MTEYIHYPNAIPSPTNGYAVGADGSEVEVDVDQFLLNVTMADISTGSSVWVVSPYAATIEKIYSVIDGAITVGNAAISVEIGGTAVTGAGITIAYSGSGAGTVDSSTPTALNTVTAGQAIEIITDGGSTDTAIATFTLVMKRT